MTHLAKAIFHDDLSRIEAIIDTLHSKIHEGKGFSYSEQRNINAAASNNTLLITPGGSSIHFRYEVISNGAPINIFLFEDSIIAANRNLLITRQCNRQLGETATLLLFNSPNITNDGTTIETRLIPATQGAAGGVVSIGVFEWILKKSVNYILRTTNGDIAQRSINLFTFWYES